MHPWYLLAPAGLLPSVLAAPDFRNPPPSEQKEDYGENPVYEFGNSLEISWTLQLTDSPRDITLFQLHADGSSYLSFENIAEYLAPADTSYDWTILPRGNLSASALFVLSIANSQPTNNTDVANSHCFNITQREAATSNATASSISPIATPTSSSTTPDTGSPNGLTVPAIIVIAVAIPCAVILGAVASWILFARPIRRARELEEESAQKQTVGSDYESKDSATELGLEGELFTPTELGAERAPAELSGVQTAIEMSVSSDAAELSPVGDAEWQSDAGNSARLSVKTLREKQRAGVPWANDSVHLEDRSRRWST